MSELLLQAGDWSFNQSDWKNPNEVKETMIMYVRYPPAMLCLIEYANVEFTKAGAMASMDLNQFRHANDDAQRARRRGDVIHYYGSCRKCKPIQRPQRYHRRVDYPKREAILAHVLHARKVIKNGEERECWRQESHWKAVDTQASPAVEEKRGREHEKEHKYSAEGEDDSYIGFTGA